MRTTQPSVYASPPPLSVLYRSVAGGRDTRPEQWGVGGGVGGGGCRVGVMWQLECTAVNPLGNTCPIY